MKVDLNCTTPLTPRQKTIVTMIAQGYSNKHMARALGISCKTVETHRAAAMRRTGSTHAAHLVRHAVRNGWVSDNESEGTQ